MKKIYLYIIITTLFMTSCTKNFLDVNQDPNNPTDISINKLLPSAELGLAYSLGFTNDNRGARGISEVTSVYMHQVVVREIQDQYGADGNEFNINGSWNGMYSSAVAQQSIDVVGCLQNLSQLIQKAEADDNRIYAGIGKILRAYAFSQLVDLYGDVPFSESNKLVSNAIFYPKFDKGEAIYPQLFELIDAGMADLTNATSANVLKPTTDDLFYGGNVAKWLRAANSIKLKLYNQIRLTTDVSSQVNDILSSTVGVFKAKEDGLIFKYGTSSSPDDRNPGYNDYYAGQKTHYMSPWFYSILKGYNPNIFTGIEDPRIPYYFYTQITPDAVTSNPTEFRDGSFVSIYFGSTGPNRDHAQDAVMTVFGLYPVGGKYDDGSNKAVNGTAGTGSAPLRLLTYADVLYIQAELIQSSVISGDSKAALQKAMDASFAQVDYVTTLAGATAPKIVGDASDGYIGSILGLFDAASNAKKMEIIMTQKWISSFGFNNDQYTDYRRTGYPVLFDPRNPDMAPGGLVQPPINGNPTVIPQLPVTVQQQRDYPLSLPWPNDERNVNPNAPAQKVPSTFPVFWDK